MRWPQTSHAAVTTGPQSEAAPLGTTTAALVKGSSGARPSEATRGATGTMLSGASEVRLTRLETSS